MKKVLLTLAAVACAASVFAQGTVVFNNIVTGVVRAPVFGPDPGNPALSLFGNPSNGTPAGSTVYAGPGLAGAGYSAQLFAIVGAGQPESALLPATPITSFRTGSAAGFVVATTATLQGVPKDAAVATLQLRVWDNQGGTLGTWEAARAAWEGGLIAAGKSQLFEVTSIGGDLNPSANITGLRSFNIYLIPEPSTFALAGLGAAALMIFRRRK